MTGVETILRKLGHDEINRATPEELKELPRCPVTVLLDNIRSAYNVGAIIRTADAIRAKEVVLSGITPDAGHKGVLKAALGAQDSVPLRRVDDASVFLEEFALRAGSIVVLEITSAPTFIEDLPGSVFPLCIVIGNEVRGVSEGIIEMAEYALEIPQYGMKQSLNASVAAGIALYGLLRRLKETHKSNF
jgi:tRNA G18 (ribose-2'-O)-methylase SpoU